MFEKRGGGERERGGMKEGIMRRETERGGSRDKRRSRSESIFNADCNAERRFEARARVMMR